MIGVGSAISTPIDATDAGPGDATDAGPRDRPRDGHDGPMQQPAAPAR